MQNTVENHRRTAHHNGKIKPPSPDGVKRKLSVSRITLLEAWFALRGLTLTAVADGSGLACNSIYNLIDSPDRARTSTLGAIAAAVPGGQRLTAEHVRTLASRRLRDPDRASDEIAEALDAGDASARQ